jgi:hypothetical protein
MRITLCRCYAKIVPLCVLGLDLDCNLGHVARRSVQRDPCPFGTITAVDLYKEQSSLARVRKDRERLSLLITRRQRRTARVSDRATGRIRPPIRDARPNHEPEWEICSYILFWTIPGPLINCLRREQ